MSICKLVPSLLITMALAAGLMAAPAARAQNAGANVVVNNINLVDPQIVNGVLTATEGTVSGTIGGLPFTTGITGLSLDLVPDVVPTPGGVCTVLDLHLAPINLAVLGAHVDTSAICLSITALEDEGVLGDLLCSVADLLNTGGLLSVADINDLLGGLTDVVSGALNGALAQATPPANENEICSGECEVLHLAVGPVDLTLLGLNVHLDNCDDGPVEVCVSATAGEGLLGDLLCGLAGGGILPDLGNLTDLINALGALDLSALDNLTTQQVNKLVKQVSKAIGNGNLTSGEIDKIVKSVSKLIRKA